MTLVPKKYQNLVFFTFMIPSVSTTLCFLKRYGWLIRPETLRAPLSIRSRLSAEAENPQLPAEYRIETRRMVEQMELNAD